MQNHVNVFHLTWIMYLHYLVKLKMLILHHHHWDVKERNSIIYLTLTVASKFTRFESSWLQHVGILQKKVYKTHITDLGEPKQQLRTERVKPDHVVIAAAIHQWHRQWVQISDACFVHLLLQYSPHAIIKWIQIWRIWMPQLRWNDFWSFFH